MTATNDTTTVPHASPPDNSGDLKRYKQGHSFLFCMCDMRRAVIILNVFGLISSCVGLITVILVDKYGDMEALKIFDGEHEEEGEEAVAVGILVAIQAVGILVSMMAIFGAVRFSICPVVTAALWNIAFIVICILNKNWLALGVHAIILYPHLVLPYELAKGIMTRENYQQSERKSCCCC